MLNDLFGNPQDVDLLIEFVDAGKMYSRYSINSNILWLGDVNLTDIAFDIINKERVKDFCDTITDSSKILIKTYSFKDLVKEQILNPELDDYGISNLDDNTFNKYLGDGSTDVVKFKVVSWKQLNKELQDFVSFFKEEYTDMILEKEKTV